MKYVGQILISIYEEVFGGGKVIYLRGNEGINGEQKPCFTIAKTGWIYAKTIVWFDFFQ